MLSKLVDRLLADETLRDEFARSPVSVIECFEISEDEVELLLRHDVDALASRVDPALHARLLDLQRVGMRDRSHPGREGARIEQVEPSVVQAGQAVDLSVRLGLGVQIDRSQAAPRGVVLRLEDQGRASISAVAAAEVVHIERRYLATVFRGVRVPHAGRYAVRIGFEGAEIPDVVWSRRLRVEEAG